MRAVQFFEGSVLSENGTGPDGEHMYSFDYEYRLEVVRDWMFQQTRTTSALRLYQQGESLRDSAQGFAPMLLAAELGYGPAQSRVGSAYQYGRGVARDYGKAAERIASAWDLGHMKAPRYLGIMQEEGLGVPVNYVEAMRLYKAASAAGDITAAARNGSLYERGLGVEQSYGQALQWYLVAAPSPEEASGNVHPRLLALLRLGYFYEKGLGVERDPSKALAWYRVAAKDNDPEAIAAVQRLSAVPLTK